MATLELEIEAQKLVAVFFLTDFVFREDPFGIEGDETLRVLCQGDDMLGGYEPDGSFWLRPSLTPEWRRAWFCLGKENVDATATERIEWQREFNEKYPRELWPESWQEEAI